MLTTYCCTKTKYTKFSNVIMLLFSFFNIGAKSPFTFEERREFCLYLCLFVVLSCIKLVFLFWMYFFPYGAS